MRTLFLDDDEERHNQFRERCPDAVHTWNHVDFAEALRGERFDVMHLDHDLGDNEAIPGMYDGQTYEWTGTDCAQMVLALPEEKLPELVIIHSWNPYGANRMATMLRTAGINAIQVPFEFEVNT